MVHKWYFRQVPQKISYFNNCRPYIFGLMLLKLTSWNGDWNFGNGYFGTTAVASAGTNSGVGTFEFDVPNGYKALCTKNINAQANG